MQTQQDSATPAPGSRAEDSAAATAITSEPSGAQAAAEPRPSCFRLNLDADGVYWGATEIFEEDKQESDVALDHVPDNPHGKYKWNRERQCLEALPVSQQKETQTVPSLEEAFAALIDYADQTDQPELPAVVKNWRVWYAKTIDQKKSAD